jgi:hypothetical protein
MRVEAGPKALINFAIDGAGIAIAAAYHAICSKPPEDAPLWPVHRRDGQLPHPHRGGRPRPSHGNVEARRELFGRQSPARRDKGASIRSLAEKGLKAMRDIASLVSLIVVTVASLGGALAPLAALAEPLYCSEPSGVITSSWGRI